MDKELKDIYYIVRRNMGRYIKYQYKFHISYFKIVGFRYVNKDTKSFIVITKYGASAKQMKKGVGIMKIFLNKNDREK